MKSIQSIVFNNFKILSFLTATCSISVFLLMLRLKLTESFFLLFLVWNLFLALIPFAISFVLIQKQDLKEWQLSLWGAVWLLFLPNAPYIITDFIHLSLSIGWITLLDTIVIALFALSGLLFYLRTVHDMKILFQNYFNERFVRVCFVLVPFLCGFGIYLGRFLRFNSWDLLHNPIDLLAEILSIVFRPMSNWAAWFITFGFGLLLWLASYFLERRKLFKFLIVRDDRPRE